MAFVLADWVWETTTTTGTGAVTLGGAVTGYRAFSSQLANADTCYYSMWDGTDFEEGLGTYTSAGNTLTRTTVYRSTNAGAAVNWGAGTRQIVCAPLGVTQQSLYTPASVGFPRRTADNTWTYYTSIGSGTVVALATAPVFTTSWGLGADAVWSYETASTIGIHTTASDAHTSGQGLIQNIYTFYTDASNYERWTVDFGFGSGSAKISHSAIGTFAGNTRGFTLAPSGVLTLGGVQGNTFAAGTNSVPAYSLTSGTNLITPTAGATEYDGVVAYFTNNASNRGVLGSFQYIMTNNAATRTLTSQTAAQAIFNSPTNGTITLPVGFFEFECMVSLTALSATSGSFGFALGGTATKTQLWRADALKNAAGSAGATPGTSFNTTNANTTLVTANTTTTGWMHIRGTIRVTVAGTVIPQISLGVASAAVVGTNSFFKIQQVANTSTLSVGNWS
jgi:hypothetical protein